MPLHLELNNDANKSLLKGLVAFILVAALSACAEGGSSGGDSSRDEASNDGNRETALIAGVAIEVGDEWLYRKGTSAAPSGWMTAGFDDSAWLVGNTGIGYGDGDDATILSDMPGNYTTVYTRKVLNYDGSFNINSLMLEIGYDDGFVAYINGQEVARDNMPAGQPSFDTQAITPIEPTTGFYDLSGFISLIGNGDNVLAIEVHNASITSSDLSFLPRLTVNMGVSQPPVVTITNGSGTYVVGDTVTLTGTATDAEDGTITGNLAWSSSIDGAIPGSGGTVSTNTLSLGTHTITASVTDSDGNSDSDTTSVTISLTPPPPQPPVVTITNGSGTYIVGDTVTLTGTATDAEDGTITGNLAWSSSIDGAIPGSGGTVSTNTLSLGTHTITASVTDSDGNSDSDTISVTVDAPVSNPPLVTITSGGGTYIVGNTATFTGTATDVEDGTITGNLAWSSSIDGPIPGSGGSVSTSTLSLGAHTITASVIDSDGNSDTDTTSVTISQSGGTIIGTGGITINDLGMHEVNHGDTFSYTPNFTGNVILCRKDLGHDDVKVDSETGRITWDTSGLTFGRGFYIRIKCSNYDGHVYATMVVHVDKSGTSRLRIAGQNGVSPYIGVAGQAMTGGDTIVFPDGIYPVSVSGNESYENAFKLTAPTPGSNDQLSTLIARNPGQVIITGEPHSGIPKQKNAIQLEGPDNLAIVGFTIKDVKRESFKANGLAANSRLLIDFVGAAGAGTNGEPCTNFTEAGNGWCSMAGMRVGGGMPLFQNSYDWGHNRYGIMTRSSNGSVTRRSFVRLDEHKGDQPYGGFSNYCDSAHLSQDNTVFDSLAIAAPHYKHYAGLEAYPATGCENNSATLRTEGLLAVNNNLSLSLMDQKAGPNHVWDHIVSYDSEGTCTPQTNLCGKWLLQADKATDVTNSFFGKARGFGGSTWINIAFDTGDVTLGAGVVLDDVPSEPNQGTPPQYLPENLLYFRGKSDTFYGDAGYNQLTSARRYPIPGEDIIAAAMRSYSNPNAFKVGGGTISIDGDRGAAASGDSMSEYFWSYIDGNIPPLVVRVKDMGANNRVAWERHTGVNRTRVTGWKVVCTASGNSVLATLNENELVYLDGSSCAEYAVKAIYPNGESGIAYSEIPN